MANPTYTQVWDCIRTASWLLYQDYRELVGPNTETFLAHEDDLKAAAELLDSPNLLGVTSALTAYRATRVGAILGGRGLLDGALVQMARVIGVPETAPTSILARLDEYMRDQVPIDTVQDIGGSFGSPVAAVGNAGNGPMVRVVVDRDGLDLEAGRATDTITVKCEADMHGGMRRGAEVFSVRGDAAGPDIVEIVGSGINGQLRVDSADTSLLRNSSFGDLDGDSAGALTTIPFWPIQVGSAGNFALSSTIHREGSNETTARSLQFNQGTTSTVRQGLRSAGVMVTDPLEEPWQFSLWYNNDSGAGGTLTLDLGAASEAFAVASGATGWTRAALGTTTPSDLYYPNWQEDDVHASIRWSGAAGFLVDDVYLGPMRQMGGTFVNIFAGSVDFLREDEFAISDTRDSAGASGVIQWALDLLYDRTLPSTGASPTIADPT